MANKLLFIFYGACVLKACTNAELGNLRGDIKLIDIINPSDLITIGDKQYYIAAGSATVKNAQQFCNDNDMRLVSFETEQKMREIYEYIDINGPNGGYDGYIWTSGEKWQDTWRWSGSGRFFTFSDWYSNNPDDPSTEVCVFFKARNGWFDAPCATYASYMCEF